MTKESEGSKLEFFFRALARNISDIFAVIVSFEQRSQNRVVVDYGEKRTRFRVELAKIIYR